MAKAYRGKIALDIRDSVPDWEPILAAKAPGIVNRPGYFCLVGDGICVGRDSASPVTPDDASPFAFTGGTIDKVVVDGSGERCIDHEAHVRAWFWID